MKLLDFILKTALITAPWILCHQIKTQAAAPKDPLGSSAVIDFIQGSSTTSTDHVLSQLQSELNDAETVDETLEIIEGFSFSNWIRSRMRKSIKTTSHAQSDTELAWKLHQLPDSPKKRRIKLLLRGANRIENGRFPGFQSLNSKQKKLLKLNLAISRTLQGFDRDLYVPKLTPTGLDPNDKIIIKIDEFIDEAYLLKPNLKIFLRVEVYKIPSYLKRLLKGNPQISSNPSLIEKWVKKNQHVYFKKKETKQFLLDEIQYDDLKPGDNLRKSPKDRKVYLSIKKINQIVQSLRRVGFVANLDLEISVLNQKTDSERKLETLFVPLPTPADIWLLYSINPSEQDFKVNLIQSVLQKFPFQNLRWGEQIIASPTFDDEQFQHLKWNEGTGTLFAGQEQIPIGIKGVQRPLKPRFRVSFKISPESFSQLE